MGRIDQDGTKSWVPTLYALAALIAAVASLVGALRGCGNLF